MEDFGKIKNVEIGTDLDADTDKYICDVEFSDSEDVRKVQIINRSGINSRPREGQQILCLNLGGGLELGISVDDGIAADLSDGEVEIYSISQTGEKSAKIKAYPDGRIDGNNANGSFSLLPSGELISGEGSDYVALSSKVDAVFDLINSIFTSWVVAGTDGGQALKTAWMTSFPSGRQSINSTNIKGD